jgi:hypothetical protein
MISELKEDWNKQKINKENNSGPGQESQQHG